MAQSSLVIKSADKALRESRYLRAYWSSETILTQRIVIYIASLLEELVKRQPKPKPKRFPSAWNLHVKKVLKSGGTIQQAAAEWRQQKTVKAP